MKKKSILKKFLKEYSKLSKSTQNMIQYFGIIVASLIALAILGLPEETTSTVQNITNATVQEVQVHTTNPVLQAICYIIYQNNLTNMTIGNTTCYRNSHHFDCICITPV